MVVPTITFRAGRHLARPRFQAGALFCAAGRETEEGGQSQTDAAHTFVKARALPLDPRLSTQWYSRAFVNRAHACVLPSFRAGCRLPRYAHRH